MDRCEAERAFVEAPDAAQTNANSQRVGADARADRKLADSEQRPNQFLEFSCKRPREENPSRGPAYRPKAAFHLARSARIL
jgi:hypothetical protein